MGNNRKSKFPFTTLLLLVVAFVIGGVMVLRKGTNLPGSSAAMMDDVRNTMSLATPSANFSPTPVVTSTPTVDEVGTALAVIQIDRATSTARAASTATSFAITSTSEAQATNGFWVGVTLSIATERGNETKIANMESSQSTKSAHETEYPITRTAVSGTQVIEQTQLNSQIAATWVRNIGFAVSVVVFIWLLLYGFYQLIKYGQKRANVDIVRKSRIQPDEKTGKFPLVPANELNGNLVNPNLQVKPVLDPHTTNDGLSNDQALANVTHAREMETVRAVAPAMAELLKSQPAKRSNGNGNGVSMPTANLKITKPIPTMPNPPRELPQYPDLPLPGLEYLNNWDGKLLPFGVNDRAAMMQVDPTVRPHFMVIGRSGSGKTISSIRPMVACWLAMGGSVVAMGKRVDFMPFANHPNFKLLAVDVRKDAQKYVALLQTLTAQMDIRDQLLASKNKSTWDQFGGQPTLTVIDDYSSAIERMPKKQAGEVVSEVKALALDGRKYGLNLLIGLQSPTWDNISPVIRSNMARIVYSVDALYSRIALDAPGAEKLPVQWNFLTRLTDDASLQHGVGFRLFDEEIDAFLASRPVSQNEPLNWVIDAEAQDISEEKPVTKETPTYHPDIYDASKPISATLATAYQEAMDEIAIEDKIAAAWLAMREAHTWNGWNALEREVYGEVKNGARSVKLKNIVAGLQGVEAANVNAEIEQLVASWGTTRSTTDGPTTPNQERSGDFSTDFGPVVA
jgi:hypothetical protein